MIIPFGAFQLTYKGVVQHVQPAINRNRIKNIGVILNDQKTGPFAIEMAELSAAYEKAVKQETELTAEELEGPGGPPEGNLLGRLLPGPPRHERKQAPAKMDDSAPKVWILRGGQPAPVPVKLGATDGQVTEIIEGDLKPGDALITEQVAAPR